MAGENLPENFYEKIKPRLHKRISRELRLAGHVLDLGCGACELVQYLARTYHQHVTGVDISDGSFPKRRHTSDGQRFRCIRKNAKHLGFANDGAQDAVVSMFAFHEMEHPESILPEACRVLRPGGEVLVIDFPRGSLAQEIWNEDYYEPDEVKRLLQERGSRTYKFGLFSRNR